LSTQKTLEFLAKKNYSILKLEINYEVSKANEHKCVLPYFLYITSGIKLEGMPEPEFANVKGAQESTPSFQVIDSASLYSRAGRYDK
jgi:hypothetical protein